jgi:hypothetical protein
MGLTTLSLMHIAAALEAREPKAREARRPTNGRREEDTSAES